LGPFLALGITGKERPLGGNLLHSMVAGVAAAQRPDQLFDARSFGQVLLEARFQLVRGKHLFGVYVVTSEVKPPKGA
jgi:hypothetical protein